MSVSIDKAIELGVQAGVKEALDRIEKANEERIKHRHDRRLRNTKLLLRNYNNFKLHCRNALYTSKQLNDMHAIDILDEVDTIDDETLYVNSIQKTHDRTYIIVKHINRMLLLYEYSAIKSKDENAIRGYKAIKLFYLSLEKKSDDDIATELDVSKRTFYRDIKQAVEELSSLIFGIDGIKLET
jgi:predicted DNA-binding transcriptional regulator YafY